MTKQTLDSNGPYFAKFCFSLGLELRRLEVIPDDHDAIATTVRRLSSTHDIVITSGGIGPTHDDITYESIAAAYNLPLKLNPPALDRMQISWSRKHPDRDADAFWSGRADPAGLEAKLRMLRLPTDDAKSLDAQALFPVDESWVPVSVVNGNVYVLPGVPRVFQNLLDGLRPRLAARIPDPENGGIHRILVSTALSEGPIAAYLGELSKRVEEHGVKVGSYPRWGKKRNTVTLTGRDLKYMETLVPELEHRVQGKRVNVEGEDDPSDTEDLSGY